MTDLARRNGRTAGLAVLLVLAMVGLAFASVPLYRLFCQVTGFDGTTDARGRGARTGRRQGGGDPLRRQHRFRLCPGASAPKSRARSSPSASAKWPSTRPGTSPARTVTGSATFNVTPVQAGKYFSKIQCFCFSEQTLKPGEEVRMPVVFFVDPRILKDPDTRDDQRNHLELHLLPGGFGRQGS